ncbi:DUF2147 domain-containing protein [Hymenobacter sp. DG25A]|uniref:DUF2147 domain-containing protein n=1 Tax=Hymenobacter sp. DG25A TaxID=1385663 RepID=UPI0006BDECD4|nr:DUF2147 domain-containing protein [Hymenobacter sp. DG25A]ALD19916.1 hypothetical protein AM218_00035 [Hymenobacter sp. DG25A]
MHLFLLLWFLAFGGAESTPTAKAIVGRWQPADKRGTLEIYEHQGRFYGKVAGPTKPRRLDTHNPDPKLRTRPILGVVILQNFRYDGQGSWKDGTIYDPNSGNTYSCILKLRNANTLVVRGYLGISLLGRTVVWTRAH